MKPTQLSIRVLRDDTIPAFGAWHYDPSKPVENGAILLNLEACFGGLEDEKGKPVEMSTEDRKRMLIETLMHELGHALETHFGLEHSEDGIEAAIASWEPKR